MFGQKPSPALNQLTHEQKEKKKDFEIRQQAFLKEVQVLSGKYMIDVVGALEYRQNALIPLVALVDIKDKMGAIAKAEEEKKKADPGNSSLIV
jgi:hypothetical protein